jgi:DNA polymerase-3 subunit alpha
MAEMKKEFVSGAVDRGAGKRQAEEIFDLIEKFASYGFNKSHSVAYSVIAYQTAYLKAHYAAEFMAATLSSEIGDTDKIVKFIGDCRKSGLEVLPPDVNESEKDFQVDFCRRVDLRLVNKKCLESLVQAGAFDSMGKNRAEFMENLERAVSFGQAAQSSRMNGQSNLFDASMSQAAAASRYPSMVEAKTWGEQERLQREKNVLGFYLSGHPLLKYEAEVLEFATVRLGDLTGFTGSGTVRACGIVTFVRKKIDKRGNTMAFVGIEDFSGKGECIVFSDPYAKYQPLLQPDAMIMVTGRGELNGESLRIVVNEVYPIERVREKFTKGVYLKINIAEMKENTIVQLRSVIEQNRGTIPCYFSVRDDQSTRVFRSGKYHVDPSEKFVEQVTRMLGQQSVWFKGEHSGK